MRAAVVPSKKSKWEVQEGNPQQHFVHPRADCRIATERARIPLRGLGLCSKGQSEGDGGKRFCRVRSFDQMPAKDGTATILRLA